VFVSFDVWFCFRFFFYLFLCYILQAIYVLFVDNVNDLMIESFVKHESTDDHIGKTTLFVNVFVFVSMAEKADYLDN